MRASQHVVIDAVDHCRVDVLAAGRREDDLLRTRGEVSLRFCLTVKQAGAFEDYIDAQLLPGQFGGISLGTNPDLVSVDHEVLTVDRHGPRKAALGRVILREVGIGPGIAQVVDCNDLDIVCFSVFVMRAQNVPANSAIAINGNPD